MIMEVRCWDRVENNIFKEDFRKRVGYSVGKLFVCL